MDGKGSAIPRLRIHVFPSLQQSPPQAHHTRLCVVVMPIVIGIRASPDDILRSTTVSRSERLVPRAEDEVDGVGAAVSSDLVQFALDGKAEAVEVEVVEIVVEGILAEKERNGISYH